MNKLLWNQEWQFSKDKETWEALSLPHTWNGIDGQDGGNDYYRGTCLYKKTLNKADSPASKKAYIEFEGTNSSADLFVNGEKSAQIGRAHV